MQQGHEFTGTVEEIGSEVKNFKKGDPVVSPFTVSWSVRALDPDRKRPGLTADSQECFYCKHRFSSRCAKSQLFGSAGLDGAQAEFVRFS